MNNWKTIITYLVNWDAIGIKTVEFSNRLIKWIYIPRKDLKESMERDELKNSWVYFLLWEDDEWNPLAYIWQATFLWKRLNDHDRDTNKDFWNIAVAFTYKDWTLNESDINFLERELIKLARKAQRFKIKNGNWWNNWLIQEYRIPDMLEFISDLKVLLESLWFKLFKELASKEELKNEENIYYLHSRWSNAKGVYSNEGFLVLKGSIWVNGIIPYQLKMWHIKRNRDELLKKWIIEEIEDWFVFRKDYLFKTPTSWCNIVSWWNLNWWTEWRNKDGKSLDEIERK